MNIKELKAYLKQCKINKKADLMVEIKGDGTWYAVQGVFRFKESKIVFEINPSKNE